MMSFSFLKLWCCAATISAPQHHSVCLWLSQCLPYLDRPPWPWGLCCRGAALLRRPPSLPPQDCACHSALGNFVPFVVFGIFERESKAGVLGCQGSIAPVVLCLTGFLSPGAGAGWAGGVQVGEATTRKHRSLVLRALERQTLPWVDSLAGPTGPPWHLTSAQAPKHACLQPAAPQTPTFSEFFFQKPP